VVEGTSGGHYGKFFTPGTIGKITHDASVIFYAKISQPLWSRHSFPSHDSKVDSIIEALATNNQCSIPQIFFMLSVSKSTHPHPYDRLSFYALLFTSDQCTTSLIIRGWVPMPVVFLLLSFCSLKTVCYEIGKLGNLHMNKISIGYKTLWLISDTAR
jgi:hypothetical protein